MSGVINKIKEAVSGHSTADDAHNTTGAHSTTGHHSTGPAVDSYGNANTGTGFGSSTTGTTGSTGYGSSNTAGPHNSNVANKLDPRVDSDRDGSRTAGQTGYGSSSTGTGHTTGTGYGSSTTGSSGYGSSTTAGPHDSNVANKLDPRVDSDRDGSRTAGQTGYGSSTTGTGHTTGHTTGTGYGSSTTGSGYGSSNTTTTGPHSSNLANKLDPRVDSDRDGSRTTGTGATGFSDTGTFESYQSGPTSHHNTGYGSSNTTAGPHNSNIANKLDPRVDSDRDGSRTSGNTGYGSGTTGTGYGSSTGTTGQHTTGQHTTGYGSSTTAGPHDSNVANKLDPRVDSDRDGSRTSGNTGYSSGTTGTGYGSSTGTTGHHNTGTGTGYGSNTTGSGYDNTTSGTSGSTVAPHKSNLLNKLDPRVDSDATRNTGGSNYSS